MTVQRFFALDSKSIHAIHEMIAQSHPDFIEIMPGVVPKVIKKFSPGRALVIAGGLIEEKSEVTAALKEGAARRFQRAVKGSGQFNLRGDVYDGTIYH